MGDDALVEEFEAYFKDNCEEFDEEDENKVIM